MEPVLDDLPSGKSKVAGKEIVVVQEVLYCSGHDWVVGSNGVVIQDTGRPNHEVTFIGRSVEGEFPAFFLSHQTFVDLTHSP